MNDLFYEASVAKKELVELVRAVVQEETKSCFRVYKAVVKTAPYTDPEIGLVCQIVLNGDQNTLTVPFSSAISSLSVGDVVLVALIYNSWRNAFVWKKIPF
jgi:hypothetical protein